MKVSKLTSEALAERRQKRDLMANGFAFIPEPIWELHRGGRTRERISNVVISIDGKSLFVKTEAFGT